MRLISSLSSFSLFSSLNSNKTTVITLDDSACPLNNSPKDSGGVKKTIGSNKKKEWHEGIPMCLQSFTIYLKRLVSVFELFFASMKKILSLVGRQGTRL